MKRWHVVHTKPRLEMQALQNLERQGYICFLPTLEIEKVSRGKFRIETEPLFPRYLFIQLEHALQDAGLNVQSWGSIRSTMGVLELVKFGAAPATISDELIAQLQQHDALQTSPAVMFQPGQLVGVTHGAFAGTEGFYQKLSHAANGQARAFILIELLSKVISLPVAPEHLKKLD
jgi:transcriptional antiterminator RfaH